MIIVMGYLMVTLLMGRAFTRDARLLITAFVIIAQRQPGNVGKQRNRAKPNLFQPQCRLQHFGEPAIVVIRRPINMLKTPLPQGPGARDAR